MSGKSGRGVCLSITVKYTIPDTPTWCVANLGVASICPSLSHSLSRASPCSAWWYWNPSLAATGMYLLCRMGTLNQTADLSLLLHSNMDSKKKLHQNYKEKQICVFTIRRPTPTFGPHQKLFYGTISKKLFKYPIFALMSLFKCRNAF